MVMSISSLCLCTNELTNQIARFQAEELDCWRISGSLCKKRTLAHRSFLMVDSLALVSPDRLCGLFCVVKFDLGSKNKVRTERP